MDGADDRNKKLFLAFVYLTAHNSSVMFPFRGVIPLHHIREG